MIIVVSKFPAVQNRTEKCSVPITKSVNNLCKCTNDIGLANNWIVYVKSLIGL
jgi:hypothetical protein